MNSTSTLTVVGEHDATGFLLAFKSSAAAVRKIQHAADERRVPLKLIRDDSAESREFYCASWILVRPDQFVAWTSDRVVGDAAEIMARAIGGDV